MPMSEETPPSAPRRRLVSRASECAQACVQQRVPITRWLPRYQLADAVPDLIAGVTVGLTLIPQSIGYASLAGLEPQYGLYSAFLGSFVYIIFGTVKEVNLGPKALLSLLTFNYTHRLGPQFAVLLCFLCGCLELLCGLLHLGFLVDLVSTPVVSGFTSAAAVMIASSQLKGLLGLKFDSESFVQTCAGVVANMEHARLGDAVLGASCCAILLALKSLKDYVKIGDGQKQLTENQRLLSRGIWFVSTARNAIVVLACALLAYLLSSYGELPFLLTGRVESGLPPLQLPPFSATVGNRTYDFLEMSSELGPGVVVTSVVAIISNLAIGKAFASGRMLDATQEMMTLGLCNIAGSMVGSMPVAGAFSRSAVSNASGVRSPLAGLYTGVMVLLSLSLLTPYFYFIPRATLAAVIMCAVLTLVDTDILPPMWRTSKKDVVACVATFLASLLLGMEIGILTGVVIDVAFLLQTNARPKVQIQVVDGACGPEYVLATPTLGLLFAATDHVRTAIQLGCERLETDGQKLDAEASRVARLPVVIDCRNFHKIDFTAARGMQSLIKDFKSSDRVLVFLNVRPGVLRVLAGVCTKDLHHAASENELPTLLRELTNGDNAAEAAAPMLRDYSIV